MKRVLAIILAMGLLLCGCSLLDPADKETKPKHSWVPTGLPTAATTEAATQDPTIAATEATTAPTQAKPETVTVYLLTESFFCDNGRSEYFYDANYNVDTRKDYDIENNYLGRVNYIEKDRNGMPCMIWEETRTENVYNLTYFEDGKLKEELLNVNESNYTGWQYEYDQKGDMTEKREYYEGILQSTLIFEYNGEELIRAYCEDPQGNHLYDCRVENGLIIEKVVYSTESMEGCSYRYEYDDKGNLVTEYFLFDGELMPNMTCSYKAVEVDADRAGYLKYQQAYLLANS